MRHLRHVLPLCLAGVLGLTCPAQEPQAAPRPDVQAFIQSAATDRVLRIGLVDCIAYVLTNNSEVMIRRIDPKLREDDIRIARSAFEPALNAGATWRDGARFMMSTSGAPGSVATDAVEVDAGISGQLSPGTRYELGIAGSRTDFVSQYPLLDPAYQVTPKITITQPLFRGAGREVNTAEIRIAQNGLAKSRQDFRDAVMTQIDLALTAYYRLYLALEQYAISAASLARAQGLLGINQERYKKGLISSVGLLEAETAVARRDKDLIDAEGRQKTAEDLLKFVTKLIDDPTLWNAELELIDRPVIQARQADLVASLERAFRNRPDYQSMRLDLANRDILVKLAANARYPTLDLVGSYALNGIGEDASEAQDRLDGEYDEATIGVRMTLPWGGGDRARLDQRRLEKEQALLSLQRLEQSIILGVRDRVRQVDIQYRQMAAARLALEKERQNYDAQKARHEAGQLSTHDLLEYEEQLAVAEADYVQAVVDYQIAWINLEHAEGTTLTNHDIVLEE